MKKFIALFTAIALSGVLAAGAAVSGALYTVGDLNSDGAFNGKDSNLMVSYLVGLTQPEDTRSYDLNFDGTINAKDSNLLIQVVGGDYVIVQPSDEPEATPVSEYTVVYPVAATQYETYAAELLCDYVSDNYGVTLTSVPDTTAETEYEILIGDTSRAESTTDAVIGTGEYLLKTDGTKIVLNGKNYMIGGAVGDLTYNCLSTDGVMTDSIQTDNTVKEYTPIDPTGVILMIGDGMGYNHVAFTDLYMHSAAMSQYSYTYFAAADMPNKGSATTYALSAINTNGNFTKVVTDSAAAATALSTGWKTQRTYLCMNAFGFTEQNICELARSQGCKTAVMSTEVMTGATPAGFTVHNLSRYNTEQIAADQQALVDNGEITYMKGAVYDELLPETKIALDRISTDSNGFFAMIEEAYIDKACDMTYGDATAAYTRKDIAYFVYRFDLAIQYAMTFAASRPDTVLIVTADHETGGLSTTGSVTVGDHTNADVPVYAMGKGTEMFNGTTVDNTDIARFMASVYGAESFGGTYFNIAE